MFWVLPGGERPLMESARSRRTRYSSCPSARRAPGVPRTVPQLARAAHPCGFAVASTGSCYLVAARHDLAHRVAALRRARAAAAVLHIGYCDPASTHLSRSPVRARRRSSGT